MKGLNLKKKAMLLFIVSMFLLSCVPMSVHAESSAKKTQKYYSVIFRDKNGKDTSGKFKKLDYPKNIPYGGEVCYVKMPKLPQIKGWKSLGWTTVKNSMKVEYKAGENVKLTKQKMRFYLVRTNTCTVKFMTRNGKFPKAYQKLCENVKIGTKILLPGVPEKLDPVPFKNMGWSYKVEKKKNPDLKPGTWYTVTEDTILYATWDVRTIPLPEKKIIK